MARKLTFRACVSPAMSKNKDKKATKDVQDDQPSDPKIQSDVANFMKELGLKTKPVERPTDLDSIKVKTKKEPKDKKNDVKSDTSAKANSSTDRPKSAQSAPPSRVPSTKKSNNIQQKQQIQPQQQQQPQPQQQQQQPKKKSDDANPFNGQPKQQNAAANPTSKKNKNKYAPQSNNDANSMAASMTKPSKATSTAVKRAHTRFDDDGEAASAGDQFDGDGEDDEKYDPFADEARNARAAAADFQQTGGDFKQSSEMQQMLKKQQSDSGYKGRQRWFEVTAADLPNRATNAAPLPRPKMEELRIMLEKQLEREAEQFEQKRGSGGGRAMTADDRFLQTVLQSGTVSDKVAAMTLMVQQAPLMRLSILDSLLTMAKKKGRRESMMAIDALKDLFLSDLLPSMRKLNFFYQQPLTFADMAQQSERLKYFFFEDALKRRYMDFCACLERGAQDEMEYFRSKILTHISELLEERPEGEQVLLTLLVNKLADSVRKVASKASFLLSNLLHAHPAMKGIVINELDLFLHRPNLAMRSQYYAIIFLNQLLFSAEDSALAQRLIRLYFSLFHAHVANVAREQKQKQTEQAVKRKELLTKLRILKANGSADAKSGNNKKGAKKDQERERQKIMASLKSLKRTGTEAQTEVEMVHTKLMSALLAGVNRAYPYANFDDNTLEEHMTELFRIIHSQNFNLAIQALQLVFQVMKEQARSALTDRFYRSLYDKLLAPELRSSSKHAMFLNVLFKAMKHDVSLHRVAAFTKRLLQVALSSTTSFACGACILLSEVMRIHAGLRMFVTRSESELHSSSSDDGADESEKPSKDRKSKDNKPKIKEEENDSGDEESDDKSGSNAYDARKRDPRFAHAEMTCIWELNQLLEHFHPSVSHFARQLLDGTPIEYLGDPLADFTTMSFLDRFMYKNPKQMEKDVSGGVNALRARRAGRPQLVAVNSSDYLQLHPSLIPEDEKFLRRFFEQKAASESGKAGKRSIKDREDLGSDVDDDDYEDVDEDEVDAFTQDLMEREMQKMHGKFDVDGDMDDADIYGDAEEDEEDVGEDDADADEDEDDNDDEGSGQRLKLPKFIKTGAGDDEEDDEEDDDGDDLPIADSDFDEDGDDNDDDENVETIMLSDDDDNEEALAMAEAGLDDEISMKALKKSKQQRSKSSKYDDDEDGDDSDDDALRAAFDDDDDDIESEEDESKIKGKKKRKGGRGDDDDEELYVSVERKSKKGKASSAFADADEFASMLESSGHTDDAKQLAWERKKQFGGNKSGFKSPSSASSFAPRGGAGGRSSRGRGGKFRGRK